MPLAARLAVALALAATCLPAPASSTRGVVVSMDEIEGSPHCALVIEDEPSGRRLAFYAHQRICEQRAGLVGKRALFHLSLIDVGRQRLEAVATRVIPWSEAPR